MRFSLIMVFFLLCTQCQHVDARDLYPEVFKTGQTEITVKADVNSSLKVRVSIVTPPKVRGNILVLPGWKFHRHRWLKETSLIKQANQNNLRLICPEMYTTLYASQYYPETRLKWNPVPGLKWIVEILLPELQKKGILTEKQDNFLLGLSTGARGVALISLKTPALWRAASALSGDYDQSKMPNDKLMQALYGSHAKFPERWQKKDNPQYLVNRWQTPLYLAHGKNDVVVPLNQTKKFYEALRTIKPNVPVTFQSPIAGHDFRFWNSQLSPSFRFFRKYNRHNK